MKRIIISAVSWLLVSPALAQNGWLSLNEFNSEVTQMQASGRYVRDIRCRVVNGVPQFQVARSGLNIGNRQWVWGYGNSILQKNLEYQKQGFKPVSSHANDFQGPIRCGVWMK
jgi:hypothetical protein